jgi:hypothetical protein
MLILARFVAIQINLTVSQGFDVLCFLRFFTSVFFMAAKKTIKVVNCSVDLTVGNVSPGSQSRW